MKISIKNLTFAATVAALYIALTLLLAPISFGPIQCRVSEALCILPLFTPYAIPGLFIGCLISNLIGGMGMFDIVFGSLTTLIAAYLTYKCKFNKYLAIFFPVILNALVVGAYLSYIYITPETGFTWAGFAIFGLQVGLGQVVSCYGIGLLLYYYITKNNLTKFFK